MNQKCLKQVLIEVKMLLVLNVVNLDISRGIVISGHQILITVHIVEIVPVVAEIVSIEIVVVADISEEEAAEVLVMALDMVTKVLNYS